MPAVHNKFTIVSMAIVAVGISTLLHEGVGHGAVSWFRGGVPIELSSNHLNSLHEDRWIAAGGTLVNLAAGLVALICSYAAGSRAMLRYFFWLLAVHNLLSGAGYFLFSGCLGIGDWQQVIDGVPHYAALRVGMAVFGMVLYVLFAWMLARAVWSFCPARSSYNVVGRLPYLAACCFNCLAGAFDPMGVRLLLISTVPAVFGGSSGMLWLDSFLPRPFTEKPLVIGRSIAWWVFAAIFGVAYILILGRGIEFHH
jgi:hypothetical protein